MGSNNSNSNNKYQMGLTIQWEIMVQGAYRRSVISADSKNKWATTTF